MTNVVFVSDLHLGHKNIHKFRCKSKGFFRDFECELDHREWLLRSLGAVLTKRTHLYCLGDMCFTEDALKDFGYLKGDKFLVRGNHDDLSTEMYLKTFKEVYGLFKYKKMWLSHTPVHDTELRGRPNIHGHVHYANVNDKRYLNVCPENLMNLVGRPFITLDEVREYFKGVIL